METIAQALAMVHEISVEADSKRTFETVMNELNVEVCRATAVRALPWSVTSHHRPNASHRLYGEDSVLICSRTKPSLGVLTPPRLRAKACIGS